MTNGEVLDTNVILEIAEDSKDVLNAVLGFDKTFYVTSIARFELLVRLPRKDGLVWLESLIELPFDKKSAEIAAYLHRKLREKNPAGVERPLHRCRLSRQRLAFDNTR